MDPLSSVTRLIDRTEEVLGHSPHPASVALPLGAWAVSNLCDGLALATGDKTYDDAARVSMAIGLVGAAGSVVTGLRDYASIPTNRPSHEIATTPALGNGLVGTLFVNSYALRLRDHEEARRPSLLVRALGLAGGALSLYTAWLGGVLVEEYGEAVKPVMNDAQDDDGGRRPAWRGERLPMNAPADPHHYQ